MTRPERFWLEEPRDLIAKANVLPSHRDSFEEKLNSVTRLIIVITIIMAILNWRHWQIFLVLSLILLVMVYLNRGPSLIEHFDEDLKDFSYYKDPVVVVSTPAKTVQQPEQTVEVEAELVEQKEEVPVQELYTYWQAPAIDFIPKRNFRTSNGKR